MKSFVSVIMFVSTVLLPMSHVCFAGGMQGGGPPAKTIEDLLSDVDSTDLNSLRSKIDLNYTLSKDELQKIVTSAPGFSEVPAPLTALTKDGKEIKLLPSTFDFAKGTLVVPVGKRTLILHREFSENEVSVEPIK